ncbi:MAG TPA: hydroxymethylbilane synthase [Chitinophagaceae bacterium]|nr:hydroxymethylbilane synthase [Chitinophagaceae bacterium]
MGKIIRIGTRESQLAVWQADRVKSLLDQHGISSELIFIKSEGDIDLSTPLYEMGVQGIFTRSLDLALLKGQIDIAVHSMKDVPTQLPKGTAQFAVLERGSFKDLLVYKGEWSSLEKELEYVNADTTSAVDKLPLKIATSSVRRKAQWLNRYPRHIIENLRGNVNTRMRKLDEENWNAAIFAAAGLERIGLRPAHSIELDWMLPAPAQGAIMVVGREDDSMAVEACRPLNDEATALCTRIERDFLRALLGGCSTPISGLAEIKGNEILFRGNILSPDGSQKADVEKSAPLSSAAELGIIAARELLAGKGQQIAEKIRNGGK